MEESTYLEDYLQSVELLPNDIRRDFELMREHDKECCDGFRELNELEPKLLRELKRKKTENLSFEADHYSASIDEINSIYQRVKLRASQKSSLAANILADLEKFIRKLDTDLTIFENELKGCGEFEQLARGIDPGSEVAIKVSASNAGFEVILGKVIFYHSDIGMYDVADSDDSKRYHISEKQILLLDLAYSVKKLGRGEEVMAVYPDTTSFYPAVVVQTMKRNMNSSEPTATVQFQGDADESGNTPNVIVALNHIIRPPADWVVK